MSDPLEKYTRESTWITKFRTPQILIKIREMNNHHLANSIWFIKNKNFHTKRDKLIVPVLEEEAKIRKLSKKFLESVPYDYSHEGEYKKYKNISRFEMIEKGRS